MLTQEWDLGKAIAFERREAWMEGQTEGRTEGEIARAMEIARKMKAMGKSVDEIIELTDLSHDDILRL